MHPVFLADIGGTTTRLAFSEPGGRPKHLLTIANDTVDSLDAAIMRSLDGAAAQPSAAILAVAGPIEGNEIALTNRAWRFGLKELSARFGWTRSRAINDFEAVAWSLSRLTDDDTKPIGDAPAADHGGKIVLGPGTGLGVAALVPTETGWCAVASEGGHVAFGPAAADEQAVFDLLRADAGSDGHVSAETILSGPGLARLYRAMNPDAQSLTSEAIVTGARGGDDAAHATIRLFARLLGRFAGDVALTFKATGGVFVAGGVAQGLGDLLDDHIFRDAFERHPPYRSFLKSIPSSLITVPEPGLLGCAALADHLLQDLG